jgi:hypothetical protein
LRRLVAAILILLTLFSVYYDLTTGTLPEGAEEASGSADRPIPSVAVRVRPGETVLTIIERESGYPPVPLEEVIDDFAELNGGIRPEQIQPGKVYRFPIYSDPAE